MTFKLVIYFVLKMSNFAMNFGSKSEYITIKRLA